MQVCNTGEATLGCRCHRPGRAVRRDRHADLDLAGVTGAGGTPVCQDVTVEFRPADEAYQAYSGTLTVMNDDDGRAMVRCRCRAPRSRGRWP
jgi:hypothetical protein